MKNLMANDLRRWQDAPDIRDPALERQIEAMTPKQIRRILEDHNIYRGSGLQNYTKAKEVVFRGAWIECDIYDRMIEVIVDHLEGWKRR